VSGFFRFFLFFSNFFWVKLLGNGFIEQLKSTTKMALSIPSPLQILGNYPRLVVHSLVFYQSWIGFCTNNVKPILGNFTLGVDVPRDRQPKKFHKSYIPQHVATSPSKLRISSLQIPGESDTL
jgi:hypothetical protein